MATIYDVEPNELIEKAAEELKKVKEIEPPVWASYIKTGRHKERPPVNKDWWYTRTAAVLRYIYRVGPIGVSKLRARYGGKKRRGAKPPHFYDGSGSIIRKVLQQLEKAGFVKKAEKGVYKGRAITPKGKSLLDKIATGLVGKVKKAEVKEPKEEKKEEKPKEAKKEKPKETKKEEKKEVKEEKPKEAKKEKPKEEKEKLPTTDELVKQTKEFAKRKKKITAQDLVDEAKKKKND